MKPLVICDLDGVIFDHRHRDHLIPKTGQSGNNEAWIEHQHPDIVAMDPILHVNASVVRAIVHGMEADLVFLTSRLDINYKVTVHALHEARFPASPGHGYGLRMRFEDEHMTPEEFKVMGVAGQLADKSYPRRVIFIEDSQSNINAVMTAHHGKNGVFIHPILMRP